MHNYKGSLIELPKKGKAMIITDIHGNIADFKKFMDIWDDFNNENNHLIITGDFIQNQELNNDRSIEILDNVIYRYENSPNFHLLLGNHEWSVITGKTVYKAGVNLSLNFERLLKQYFEDSWVKKMEIYKDFLKSLPIAVKTKNKVFISHAGPSKHISGIEDIVNIKNSNYMENNSLYDLLWSRYGDYDKNDIKEFLNKVGCNAIIVGHTPVDGTKLINKMQLIVSSSYTKGKKAYVELDLEKEINNAKDILKMVKYIN